MIPRYTRPEMGRIWSEENGFQKWLDVEILAAERLAQLGKVPKAAIARIRKKARFDVKRTLHEYYGHYDRMAMDASISGDEMVEGFRAFKERRSPSWVPEELRKEGRL